MPIMDGWTATLKIFELYRKQIISYKPVVIGNTAYTDQEDLDRCLQVGMDVCLNKPLNVDDLMSYVARYV